MAKKDTYRGDKIEAPIRDGRGQVTGYITLYWAKSLGCYVSIPGREA